LYHIGLETNEDFVKKTKAGIRNLKRIIEINDEHQQKLIKDISLLNTYCKLQKLRLTRLFHYLFRMFEKRLYKNLTGKKPNLIVFDFYKLGYLCKITHQHSNLLV
ncbi:MAG: hypothetical protein HC896_17810, partial [Bacteroidales bacterium]|nr:hypothetical protein [Bacteroidales bacterium]